MTGRPSIVPYFSYAEPGAAIEFLENAFGFETVQRIDGAEGKVLHCEMAFGNGVIMLGTVDWQPAKQSPGVYLVVADVDAHHERAKAAGATIVYPPEDTEFGTRRYRARDPEGHEWSFGTYQPQTTKPDWA